MTSRKRHFKPHGPSWKENNGNSSGSYSQRSKNYYFCDACGSNVPSQGNTPPMCPRCMIPMQLLNQGSQNRNRNQQPTKSFDYSSRIYYPTEGHPQYKGLPLDHPDPEDDEAMSGYLAKKEANRRDRQRLNQPRPPQGQPQNKEHRRPYQKYSKPYSASQKASGSPHRSPNVSRESGRYTQSSQEQPPSPVSQNQAYESSSTSVPPQRDPGYKLPSPEAAEFTGTTLKNAKDSSVNESQAVQPVTTVVSPVKIPTDNKSSEVAIDTTATTVKRSRPSRPRKPASRKRNADKPSTPDDTETSTQNDQVAY